MQTLEQKAWHELECAARSAGGIEVAMVSLPIEKVKALVAGHTLRAAPVEGLETKGHLFPDGKLNPLGRAFMGVAEELVTRSQAEAIIAAERARYSALEEIAAGLVERTDKAEADNAALTAWVKELGGKCDQWKANHDCVLGKYRIATQRPDLPVDRLPAIRRLDALETQLAAARKALEEIATDRFGDYEGIKDFARSSLEANHD